MMNLVPKMQDVESAAVITESIVVSGSRIVVERPADMDRLIDSHDVGSLFRKADYLPYWATIWPVSRALASKIICAGWNHHSSVLELGCGLGLAGLAAMIKGHDVTFSDYDENALSYAARNARLNGNPDPKILPMNWRDPRDHRFDVIIGADLTWDQALVPHVVKVFARMLKPDGVIWLADQNRLIPDYFKALLHESGLRVTRQEPLDLDANWGWDIAGTFYEICHHAQ